MPRVEKFEPVEVSEGWRVNVPAKFSETGKRQRRIFDTKKEADGFCQKMKVRRTNHGTAARVLSPAKEGEAVAAFTLLEEAGISTPLQTIVGEYIARQNIRNASKMFVDVFDTFVALKPRRPAYKVALDALRKITLPLHEEIICDISPGQIDDLLSGMGPAHRNQRLRELRAVFNYGLKKEWTRENPIARLDRSEHEQGETEIYEPEEMAKLLLTAANTEPRLIPIYAIGGFAGIRSAERQRMNWPNIDIPERSIDLERSQTKKGRRRSIEINDTLLAWLEWYIEKFGIQRGPVSAWKSIWTIRPPIRKLHEAAGVPFKQNALRHSFASYHLAQHKDIDALVILLGHKGDAQVLWDHYHRSVRKAAAEVYWGITPENLFAGKIINADTPPVPIGKGSVADARTAELETRGEQQKMLTKPNIASDSTAIKPETPEEGKPKEPDRTGLPTGGILDSVAGRIS
jgi:integrase